LFSFVCLAFSFRDIEPFDSLVFSDTGRRFFPFLPRREAGGVNSAQPIGGPPSPFPFCQSFLFSLTGTLFSFPDWGHCLRSRLALPPLAADGVAMTKSLLREEFSSAAQTQSCFAPYFEGALFVVDSFSPPSLGRTRPFFPPLFLELERRLKLFFFLRA